MKKEEQKLIKKFTKEELFKIVKTQDNKILRLEKEYHRALRTIASYRNIIQTEMRSAPEYWNQILDDMVEEFEESTPPDAKVPMKQSKKKDVERGYS